jgi:hypothetical protein
MKSFSLFLLLIVTTTVSAQKQLSTSVGGWRVENHRMLTWQHVYNDSADADKIFRLLRSSSWITDIEERGSTTYAKGRGMMITSRAKTSTDLGYFPPTSQWNMAIIVDRADGRYRVTVTNVTYNSSAILKLLDNFYFETGILEEALTSDQTAIRPAFKVALESLDEAFKDAFDTNRLSLSPAPW